jgi:hypothetical protein
MNPEDIDKIKYALTLRAGDIPALADEVAALCGCVPSRENMRAHFAQCGHDNLLPLWVRLIEQYPEATILAKEVWKNYQRHIDNLNKADDPNLPPLTTMAANLAGAIARDLKAGRPRRTAEQVDAIIGICKSCEKWRPTDRRCSLCGCYMQHKAAWATEHCKLNKW